MNPGELMFARQRMTDFLSGRGPGGWDIRMPERIANQLRSSITRYLRSGAEPPEAVDVDWVFSLPDDVPDQAEASIERLPDEVVVPYVLTSQRAMGYLRELVPVRSIPGLVLKRAVTNHAERAKMRRAAAAVEDPVGLLSSPEYLSTDAVEAIAAVYPDLYADTVTMVGEAIAALKRPLRAREETSLSKLVGGPVLANAALQGPDQSQQGVSPASPRGRPRGKPPIEPEIQTPHQRVQNQ